MRNALIQAALIATATIVLPTIPMQPALAANPAIKADLADRVAGTYEGAVTSGSRGSSRNNITITITKIGRNMVEISCDYDRIPTQRIALQQVADSIQAAGKTDVVFLVELSRDPNRVDLYIDGAALSVRR